MRNKLTNLLIWEPGLSLKLAVIVVVILSWPFLGKRQRIQAAQLKKVKEEKLLVAQLPELEKQLGKIQSGENEKIAFQEEAGPALKGIFMQDKAYYAIIDDTFYQEGDTLGDFEISKISFYYVIFQHRDTKKTKILYYSK